MTWRALMVLGLVVIPSLVSAGACWERRHVFLGRVAEARAALGKDAGQHLLDRLVRAYPDNAEVHFLRARHFRLTKQDGPALESLAKAAELVWPKSRVNREKVLVLGHLDFPRVQRYLQLILDRNPLDRDVLLVLAEGYYLRSSPDKAELLVGRWLERSPDDCEALFLRGKIVVRARHWEQAGRDLARAVAAGPGERYYPGARKLLASVYLELGQFEEALAMFRECRRADPKDTEVLYNLGQAATFLQRWDEALAVFQEALRLRPERDVLLKTAHVHEMRNELPKALALLERAENGDPKDVEVMASMARVLQGMGQAERAREYRERYDRLKDLWTEARARAPSK
jgi:tetratricopeptide (TPR) repeat protein